MNKGLRHFIKDPSKDMRWDEKSIKYTGQIRCPYCVAPMTQTKFIVPGNTKAVKCTNCNKQQLIPRKKWKEYSERGLI